MGNDGTGLACYLMYQELKAQDNYQSLCKYIDIKSWAWLHQWREKLTTLVLNEIKSDPSIAIIGGNHLVALPVYDYLIMACSQPSLILRFDAHTDLESSFDLDSLYTGNFMSAMDCTQLNLISVGSARKSGVFKSELTTADVNANPELLQNTVDAFVSEMDTSKAVLFIDIDVDVLDKRDFSSTLSQESSGIRLSTILDTLSSLPEFEKRILVISEMNSHSPCFRKDINVIRQLITTAYL